MPLAGANTDERNLLISIECASAAMADAAGGTPINCYGNDISYNLLGQIAINMRTTVLALGGTAVVENFTSTLGLWQTIQCYSAALTGLTGTAKNFPGYVNEESAVNAVVCNLAQVDSNVGGTPDEENVSAYVPGLETIACLMESIAEKGFTPVDPVQAFINSLLVFNPDLLLIGDTVTTDPVTAWPDSSGHGRNASLLPSALACGPIGIADLNGKNGVIFNNGSNIGLGGLFPNSSTAGTAIVVYKRTTTAAGAYARVVSTAPISGLDNNAGGLIFLLQNASDTTSIFNFSNGAFGTSLVSPLTTPHLNASWNDGANFNMIEDGVTATPNAGAQTFSTTTYSIGNTIALADYFDGEIWFVMLFAADKTAQIPAILNIVGAYYGLPIVNPVQAFINSLLPYSPDILIIADTFVGSIGDTVNTAPDSSGNGNDMTSAAQALQALPTIETGTNGKRAYSFVTTGNLGSWLECPFPTTGTPCLPATVTVVQFNGTANIPNNSARIATTHLTMGGGDAGNQTPIFAYSNAGAQLGSYYGGSDLAPASGPVDGTWVSTSAWIDTVAGGTGHLLTTSIAPVSAAGIGGNVVLNPLAYAAIGGTANSCYQGKIAFHARWQVAPSAADIASFRALVDAYYGL